MSSHATVGLRQVDAHQVVGVEHWHIGRTNPRIDRVGFTTFNVRPELERLARLGAEV